MDVLFQQLSELMIAGAQFLPQLVVAVVVFVASLLVARLARSAVTRAAQRLDEELKRLVGRLTAISIIVIGTVVALDQVGFDVTGLFAGLGLVGLTLGFAFQDIAKNLMAGMLLLMQQPFDIGDAIKVCGHVGSVTDIDIRATTIKAPDGQEIIVPNAEVYTSTIINYSKYPTRRIVLDIGLGYDEEIGRAQEVFVAAIRDIEDVLDDPAPTVYCRSLGSGAVKMEVYLWADQTRSNLLEVTSAAVQALKEAAAREGINLPYPIQSIRLRQLVEEEQL